MDIKEFERLFVQEAEKNKVIEYNLFFTTTEGMKRNHLMETEKHREQIREGDGMLGQYATIGHEFQIFKKRIGGRAYFNYFLFNFEDIINLSDKAALSLIRHELAHCLCAPKEEHGINWIKKFAELEGGKL